MKDLQESSKLVLKMALEGLLPLLLCEDLFFSGRKKENMQDVLLKKK